MGDGYKHSTPCSGGITNCYLLGERQFFMSVCSYEWTMFPVENLKTYGQAQLGLNGLEKRN